MPVADPRFTGLVTRHRGRRRSTGRAAADGRTHSRRDHRRGASAYTDPPWGRMGQNIENAVQASLGAFLRLATRGGDSARTPRWLRRLDGAYELGRGEARDGRSIDALLAAYRVGARVAWRELSATAVGAGLPAQVVARFAERRSPTSTSCRPPVCPATR